MFKSLSAEALGLSDRPGEMIELALSFGFKGVELNIVEFAEQVKTHGLPHARRLLESSKLKIAAFKVPFACQAAEEDFRQGLEKLVGWAKLAADLGCTRALTWVEPASEYEPYHQNFELHRRRLGEIARQLEPAGVRLGVGFRAASDLRHGSFEFIRGLDALALLLSVVQAKNVGIILDLWDWQASGGAWEGVQKLGVERIVAVQLADASADAAEKHWLSSCRLLPAETGQLDATPLLVWLAEHGYAGPVTPVPSVSQLKGLRRDAVAQRAGAQLDKCWKAAGLGPTGKLATTTTASTTGRR